ncbi:MAG: ZPR1 zinc finger domain-containing protein [Candidatus Asgardarchaeia archaeon]
MDLSDRSQRCPICGSNKLKFLSREIKIPYFGRCWLTSLKCEECGYKKTDVIAEERAGPKRLEFKVKKAEDLFTKVVKSSKATIRIPELGFEMVPGPLSQGFITNIEGLLEIMEDVLDRLELMGKSKEKISEVREKIEKAKEGKMNISIIIEDPSGISRFVREGGDEKR